MKSREISSFRDPSGYIYYEKGKVFRKINPSYFQEYHHLMDSGLYHELVQNHLLIPHHEIISNSKEIILEVEKVPYISYPYEWSFDELKDAALLTIHINQVAMKYGMILKDASSYNVQFIGSNPIFIDTLSFMFYEETSPWGAYGQFTKHFIAPLVLMKYVDVRLNCLLENYIDGIPLDLCSRLLGHKGGIIGYLHIKLQDKSIQRHNQDGSVSARKVSLSKKDILNMFSMIERQIKKLSLQKYVTEWMSYYEHTNYSSKAADSKRKIVKEFCSKLSFTNQDLIFDIGSNDGTYSRLIESVFPSYVIAFDIDSNAVQSNYHRSSSEQKNILPLIMDIWNPSSNIGFANRERSSFMDRGCASLTLALAFLHHLVISNNLSFEMVAEFFSKITRYLIIEFVSKEDSQVQLLLQTREDIFDFYSIETFRRVFSQYFDIIDEKTIDQSSRSLFLMEVRDGKSFVK